MKQLTALIVAVLLLLSVSCAEDALQKTQSGMDLMVTDGTMSTLPENTDNTGDAEWNLPETIEMTEEAAAIFHHAVADLVGVTYEPLGFLGEKDGVYCFLCRAAVVSPDAKPGYSLVYVKDDGIQNIWEIWMDAHSKK